MSTLIAEISDTRDRISRSERIRFTVFACFSGLLGVVFIALLIADEAHAAGF